jgi:hypothetical protein
MTNTPIAVALRIHDLPTSTANFAERKWLPICAHFGNTGYRRNVAPTIFNDSTRFALYL